MQNPLMQTIEALAKEKGIEAETIVTAIEDAVLTASRKYYKTNENLKTRFNQETGQVDLFAIKHIVESVEDASTQISLKEAQEIYGEEAEVDMVGACVGMKGTSVQAIIRELRGEKIDIVEWSDDVILFVTNALSPAKVQRVSIVDDKERVMEVVVEDKQLSLAIGKKGQNVRLAAKLTGWRIDIKSEEEKRREVEAQLEGFEVPAPAEEPAAVESAPAEAAAPVFALPGVSDKTMRKLVEAGF